MFFSNAKILEQKTIGKALWGLLHLLNISMKLEDIIFIIIDLNKAKAFKVCLKSICSPIKYLTQYIICNNESGRFI